MPENVARPPAIPDYWPVNVGRERAAARITAYKLLTAASEALTTGEPPDYPPLPEADPRTLAVIGAALGAMARSCLPKGHKIQSTANQEEQSPGPAPAEASRRE